VEPPARGTRSEITATESALEEMAPTPHLETPVGYADFPKEVAVPPFSWITQRYNIVQKTGMPKGGHFAALEQPDLLVADIRKFFAKVGAKGVTDGT
jgi:pimeloyl-ACP methyl ester carboxylesterase